MGSNLNFKQLGNMGNSPLSSVYSLTFDEFQNSLGGIGKDLGSMNMDELVKNIWTAEEIQNTGGGNSSLHRQGSLTLPRTLSHKTVDEVWKDVSKNYKESSSSAGFGGGFNLPKEATLGEVTLEEFLVRGGVVREEANKGSNNNVVGGIFCDLNPLVGIQSAQLQMPNYNGVSFAGNEWCNKMSNGETMTSSSRVSPLIAATPYVFNCGGGSVTVRGRRRSGGGLEKVVERRQRRMIKNRESAARSRARKQAYTMELEAEVAKLKEENQELMRKQQPKMMEMQKNQVVQMANQQRSKKQCLRRTQTCPW